MLLTDQGTAIKLAAELGASEEAAVFQVEGAPGYAAKIYRHEDRWKLEALLRERDTKVRAMLATVPQMRGGQGAIAWPVTALRSERGFAGYLMEGVEGKALSAYQNPVQRRQYAPNFNWLYLHRTAFNVATIMEAIHEAGHIVGDVNNQKFLVRDSSLVSAIDTDTYQIHAPEGRWYLCPVGRPEYTPPELQGKSLGSHRRGPEQDVFGLGVLIFELLMEGAHPFGVKTLASRSVPETRLQAIQYGFFAYGRTGNTEIATTEALSFNILDPALQALFRRCFVAGHDLPSARPKVYEWCVALSEAEQNLVRCDEGHYYRRGLSACPWCARNDQRLRRVEYAQDALGVPIVTAGRNGNGNGNGYESPRIVGGTGVAVPKRRRIRFPVRPLARTYRNPQREDSDLPDANTAWQTHLRTLVEWITTGLVLGLVIWFGVHALAWASLRPEGAIMHHERWITSAQFSPDGRRIATTAWDHNTRIWDAATGKQVGKTMEQADPVNGASFSANGQMIVSFGGTEAHVWNAETGEAMCPALKHSDSVICASFDPEGKHVLTASGNTVQLWQVADGKKDPSLVKCSARVTKAIFSPDGSQMLVARQDGFIQIWDAVHWKPLGAPVQLGGPVGSVAYSRDGHTLLTLANDKAQLWDASHLQAIGPAMQAGPGVTSALLSPNSGLVLLTSWNMTASLWNASTSKPVSPVLRHATEVISGDFSPAGDRIVTCTTAREAQVWDWESGRPLGRSIRCESRACFSPDGRSILTMAGNSARLWRTPRSWDLWKSLTSAWKALEN